MLITVVLLLFKLEHKKELHEEVNKSQWSAPRGFNWQHSKSYIMLEPTDLFCHTIFFSIFNMLTSLSLQFLLNIYGAYTLIWFSSGVWALVSAHKVWRDLFMGNFFMADGRHFIGGGGGSCSTWGINDQVMSSAREFHKYIFQ